MLSTNQIFRFLVTLIYNNFIYLFYSILFSFTNNCAEKSACWFSADTALLLIVMRSGCKNSQVRPLLHQNFLFWGKHLKKLIFWLTVRLIHLLTDHGFINWQADWLIDWFIDWLIHWHTNWLSNSLSIGWLTGSFFINIDNGIIKNVIDFSNFDSYLLIM